MEKTFFIDFCDDLGRRNSRGVMLEERVAIFLFIIEHNICHRVVINHFQHSIETIPYHFNEVLRVIC